MRADNKQFAGYVETQFAELRADNKSLREKVDRNFQTLFTKIDSDVKETNKALSELSKMVLKIDSRLSAIPWVGGGLVALITVAITVGKALDHLGQLPSQVHRILHTDVEALPSHRGMHVCGVAGQQDLQLQRR